MSDQDKIDGALDEKIKRIMGGQMNKQVEYGERLRREVIVAGKVIKDVVRISDGLQVKSDLDIHTALDELLASHRRGELLDPAIELKTDTKTGNINRVVKSWTDPESKLY